MTAAHVAPSAAVPRARTRKSSAAAQPAWFTPVHDLLLYAFLEYTYIGLTPFTITSVDNRVEGSPLVQVAGVSLCFLSFVVMWPRRGQLLLAMRENWAMFLVLAISLASTVWSQFPDLTIRRAALLVCISAAAIGVAVGVDNMRAFHTKLFGFMTAVIIINLALVVVWPAQAISDIGVKGLYIQKNVAGIVAMVTVVIAVTWTFGCASWSGRFLGIASALLSTFFLVLTDSKTSIGLLVLGLAIGAMFYAAQKLGPRFALLAFAGVAALVAAIGAILIFFDFDYYKILVAFVADPTFTGRNELWAFAYHSAMKHEWFGYGYGAFWDVGFADDPLRKLEPGTWLGDSPVGLINQAHNGYLELWLHIGLIATLIAIWSVFAAIGRATRRAIETRDAPGARPVFTMIALVLFLHLLHNFTEATLYMRNNPYANIVTLLIALTSWRPFPRPKRSA
ncbi:O-antigen ligase family protein [Rhodoblastus acidophilus]|uniref:O-antigen ligase family protein n=1 Tax=Candidatus Rhodoblastus alkanivorans TaxID=2954117 RepID=A0ABS9Z2N6_9HYPH|nr:O-antigen ligase family protein [Candidatus Rhodoblastus alkanivorans]MCI4680446.1 O-antigen ligase family protein [Candidatus Rhodoblastus alkanivorans]MCI4681939.1 O-antigen ligase family protein [Candidatus Rhodoblastus alkanivorans]MDI4642989.1 O-antigen ligase family protein [Rhodoblastus acidophilus]